MPGNEHVGAGYKLGADERIQKQPTAFVTNQGFAGFGGDEGDADVEKGELCCCSALLAAHHNTTSSAHGTPGLRGSSGC